VVKLGILSDTHVPDRKSGLPASLCASFQAAGVTAILHAGDVCVPAVLEQLGQVAPVYAVRGNRDIYALRHLPSSLALEFAGVKIGLIHGHGGFLDYLQDKVDWVRHGIREERFRQRVLRSFPEARLVIFGHLHRRINEWVGEQFLFNPGSACCPDWVRGGPPSAGLISLEAGEIVQVEFLDLGQS